MSDTFNHNGMNREELCKLFADVDGDRNDFTDKDFEWVDSYEYAFKKTDEWLHEWAYSEGL